MKVLAGDIGGTQCRFAVFDVKNNELELKAENCYQSQNYPSFEAALDEFVADLNTRVDAACFGVAGPVLNGRCLTTNLPWELDQSEIGAVLSTTAVELINDLTANSLGIGALSEEDLYAVHRGNKSAGNACLIAAGTGLGEAGLYWDGLQHQPFDSEGGHCDFCPQSELDFRLFSFLADRFEHVSWERVVSGVGIVNLFEFLCHERSLDSSHRLAKFNHSQDPASIISWAALNEQDPVCVETMQLFMKYYGTEAGNLALKTLATGGIYIGGGIAPKILELFKQKIFHEALCAKGRMKGVLEHIPVRIILNDKAALLGAAIQASKIA